MGIRINKIMGWVFKPTQEIDYETLESTFLKDLNQEGLKHIDINLQNHCSEDDSLSDYIFVTTEEGKPPLCIIVPPMVLNMGWKRYDSSIDYQEAMFTENASRKVKIIRGEVFPYAQPFVVSKSLKIVPKEIMDQMFMLSDNPHLKAQKAEELKELGFDLDKPLKKQIHMTPPLVVQRMLEKVSSIDYRLLKPAIVTYWD